MTHKPDIGRRHENRFIEHYFPDATVAERDTHRADLQGFASVMFRIASRVARDGQTPSWGKFDSIPEFGNRNEG